MTHSALRSFFKILEQQQVPLEDLDHTLRQIATSYKDLQAELQSFTSDDPAVVALKQQARTALEAGEVCPRGGAASMKPVPRTWKPPNSSRTRHEAPALCGGVQGRKRRAQGHPVGVITKRRTITGRPWSCSSVSTQTRNSYLDYLNAWGLVSHRLVSIPRG